MTKPANKKSTDYTDRIPTLTEVVSVPVLPAAEPEPPATPAKGVKSPPARELPKDLPETVERLVYKALYRQLPALSKEIGAEIISSLEKQLLDKKSR